MADTYNREPMHALYFKKNKVYILIFLRHKHLTKRKNAVNSTCTERHVLICKQTPCRVSQQCKLARLQEYGILDNVVNSAVTNLACGLSSKLVNNTVVNPTYGPLLGTTQACNRLDLVRQRQGWRAACLFCLKLASQKFAPIFHTLL